jgi:hypothetical protein
VPKRDEKDTAKFICGEKAKQVLVSKGQEKED